MKLSCDVHRWQHYNWVRQTTLIMITNLLNPPFIRIKRANFTTLIVKHTLKKQLFVCFRNHVQIRFFQELEGMGIIFFLFVCLLCWKIFPKHMLKTLMSIRWRLRNDMWRATFLMFGTCSSDLLKLKKKYVYNKMIILRRNLSFFSVKMSQIDKNPYLNRTLTCVIYF